MLPYILLATGTRGNLKYLKSRDNLKNTDRMFDIAKSTLIKRFSKINDELNIGRTGQYNRFRSHMLRKFHTTSLRNDGINMENANVGKIKKQDC